MAKGALRPQSPLAGRLDLFLSADIAYTASRRSDLHSLRETHVTRHRLGLRSSWTRVLAASYFVQLLEHVAEPATPIPDLSALLTRGLDYLESHDPDLRAMLHFEQELARLLGLHNPKGTPAIQALRQTFHHIPASREKLLDSFKSPPSTQLPPTSEVHTPLPPPTNHSPP